MYITYFLHAGIKFTFIACVQTNVSPVFEIPAINLQYCIVLLLICYWISRAVEAQAWSGLKLPWQKVIFQSNK